MTANCFDALSAAVFFALVGYGILIADQESTAEIEQGLWGMLGICVLIVTVVGTAATAKDSAHGGGVAIRNTVSVSQAVAVKARLH